MKKSRVWSLITVIAVLGSVFLIGQSIYNGMEYAKYYDYPIKTIVSDELDYEDWGGSTQISYGLSEWIQEYKTNVKWFSGVEDAGELKFQSSEIQITSQLKSGELKVLITDMQDNVIYYGEIKESEINVVIPQGQCKLKLVGSWASGNVTIKSGTIYDNPETIDYTDEAATQMFKEMYHMVSLESQKLYMNGDTLYMDYYFDRQVSDGEFNAIGFYNQENVVLGKVSLMGEIPYEDVLMLGETKIPWSSVRVTYYEKIKPVGKPDSSMIFKNIDRTAGIYEVSGDTFKSK